MVSIPPFGAVFVIFETLPLEKKQQAESFVLEIENRLQLKSEAQSFIYWLKIFDSISNRSQPAHTHSLHIKKLIYQSTLVLNKAWHFFAKRWWDEITPGLYLGALPLHGHLETLRITLQAVLSMVEEYEREESLLHHPIKGSDWESIGIVQKSIPIADFTQVPLVKLHEGVEFVKSHREKNENVYIHCKAGKSRSAAIVVSYLATALDHSLAEAINLTKKQRPIINIQDKIHKIELYVLLFEAFYNKDTGSSNQLHSFLQSNS